MTGPLLLTERQLPGRTRYSDNKIKDTMSNRMRKMIPRPRSKPFFSLSYGTKRHPLGPVVVSSEMGERT